MCSLKAKSAGPIARWSGSSKRSPLRRFLQCQRVADKPKAVKSQPAPAAAIERAIKKVRQARKLVCNEKNYDLWTLLYEAEEEMLKAQNGGGR